MSQPDITITEPAVLGVSVLGEDIATVVRDATGEIVASNFVELSDASADGAYAAFSDLVDSAPFTIVQTVIACADASTRAVFEQGLRGEGAPDWAAGVTFVPMSAALAQAARREADGLVAVVALDRAGAVPAGESLALVDASHATAIKATEVAAGQDLPVTDAQGSVALRDALTALAKGIAVTGVLCVGSGAELPGMSDAVATATGLRTTVAPAPIFAIAQGATQVMTADTRLIPVVGPAAAPSSAAYAAQTTPVAAAGTRTSGLRWWAIGGALGLAALLCLITLVALFSGNGGDSSTANPSTVTVPGTTSEVTVTERGAAATATVVDEQTVTETVTTTRSPVTETSTVTETATETSEATVTSTEQTTVTETTTVTADSGGRPGGE